MSHSTGDVYDSKETLTRFVEGDEPVVDPFPSQRLILTLEQMVLHSTPPVIMVDDLYHQLNNSPDPSLSNAVASTSDLVNILNSNNTSFLIQGCSVTLHHERRDQLTSNVTPTLIPSPHGQREHPQLSTPYTVTLNPSSASTTPFFPSAPNAPTQFNSRSLPPSGWQSPSSNTSSHQGAGRTKKMGPPAMQHGVHYINPEEEDQMEIRGYRPSLFKMAAAWLCILLTLGILRLIFHWRSHWMIINTHSRCPLGEATVVLLVDHYNQTFVEKITVRKNEAEKGRRKSVEIEDYGSIGSNEIIKPLGKGMFEVVDSIKMFDSKKVRYFWDDEQGTFIKVPNLDKDVECSYFYRQNGLSPQEEDKRQSLYGKNEIEVKVSSIMSVLVNEVLGPFYVFQMCSIVIWLAEDYEKYAICIVIMSAVSLISSVIQIRKSQKQLRDTVVGADMVTVYRGGDIYVDIPSESLVPGDIVCIPSHGCIMQCDAVVISGNVIVNESMLTGESVPVTKTPLPDTKHKSELYESKEHAKHTLFCGTKVIQTRYYDGGRVRAVVIRTAFQTAKGELVRSIMFPKPVDFKFNRHIYTFIQYMAILAMCGFIYTVVLKVKRHVPIKNILLKSLDLITIVIPPALPMAMTIGVVYAQARLKASSIFCISPRSINISGCINCVCFDKTGTLTEDDLSFSEVVPVNRSNGRFSPPVHDLKFLEEGPLLTGLASCHSLTIIDGETIGDPLDQKMFNATNWILEEPAVDDTTKYDLLAPAVVRPPNSRSSDMTITSNEVGILKQFPFSSSLQRMSVVTRTINDSKFDVFIKGAPEIIVSLCKPDSLPHDFDQVLQQYTQKGFRVLAMAHRPLPVPYIKMNRFTREDIEKDLAFTGLLVMGNMLKPETTNVIDVLLEANIRCVMVTGDNMLTALSVARDCHMIQPHHRVALVEAQEPGPSGLPHVTWKMADSMSRNISKSDSIINIFTEHQLYDDRLHVAITGKTFRILRDFHPDLLRKVAIRGTVFSRMAPDQKQQLIEMLQDLGYYVGMCGDGANDCGALKAAHAGISLSEAEASVASPFTSKNPNISCIPTLIREGRASLVTAFGILKYMACYSICQFSSVLILYTLYSNLTDFQFLYQDLFLISLFFVLFGRTEAFKRLDKNAPPSSLIGLTPMVSLATQLILICATQGVAILLLWKQPWYKPHYQTDKNLDDFVCHDNYAVFTVSVFQYITLAVVFSKGAPYRRPVYSNYLFLASLILMTLFTIYVVINPTDFISELFEFDLSEIPMDFRIMMILLAIINFILAFLCETFLVDYLVFVQFKEWLRKVTSSDTVYERIFKETRTTDWLPSTDHSGGGKSTLSQIASNENGFVHYSNAIVQIDLEDDEEAEMGTRSKCSPPESGICVSSPTSIPPSEEGAGSGDSLNQTVEEGDLMHDPKQSPSKESSKSQDRLKAHTPESGICIYSNASVPLSDDGAGSGDSLDQNNDAACDLSPPTVGFLDDKKASTKIHWKSRDQDSDVATPNI